MMPQKVELRTAAYRRRGFFVLVFLATLSELDPLVSKPRSAFSAAFLILSLTDSAWADDVPKSPDVPDAPSQPAAQVIYKGLIGNVLDTVPMDPVKRAELQRANAVVSNTFSGRSLAVLIGLSNPILMIGGLVWGLWSASNIQPVVVQTTVAIDPVKSGIRIETEEHVVHFAESSPAKEVPDAGPEARTSSLAMNSFAGSDSTDAPPTPVVRIWLPQRLR